MPDRSGYIGRAPGDSSIVLAKQYFQPTGAGKTFTFTAGYEPGLIDVYRNGVKLINVLDYAATDGKDVVLETPVGVGSTVQVVAYKGFNLTQINSSTGDFTVGSNLYVQSGFGSFAQGITANQINVSGIGTIGIGSFTDINVSGGATVSGTLVANSFSGDGSALTGLANTAYIVSVATTTGDLKVGAAVTIGGAVNIDATTDSTSTSTGALIVDGGVGIAKNVYIGAGLSVAGTLTYEDVTNVDSVGMVTAKSGVNVSGGELNVGLGFSVGNAGVVTAQNVTISAGTIDLKNSGSVSNIKLYCESSNSHYTQIQSAAHGEYSGNVTITLPTTTDTLIGKTTTDTLTNKTLTSPTINTLSGDTASFSSNLTVGSGITFGSAGVATFSGTSDIHLHDSVRLLLGTGSDLRITHDGSHGYIQENTGDLRLDGDTIQLRSSGGENYLRGNANGAVDIYYDASKKFETTTTGVSIAGTTISSGGDFITYDNGHVKLGQNSDLDLFHNGTDSFIRSAVNNLNINAGNSAQNVYINLNENVAGVTSERAASFNKNGSVDLYYDNSKKFETTSYGVSVGGSMRDDKGDLRQIPANVQTSAYTLVASDSGKLIDKSGSGAVTIPNNIFGLGDTISILNNSGSDLTITASISTLYNVADAATGNRTLAGRGLATIYFTGGTSAYISGGGLS